MTELPITLTLVFSGPVDEDATQEILLNVADALQNWTVNVGIVPEDRNEYLQKMYLDGPNGTKIMTIL